MSARAPVPFLVEPGHRSKPRVPPGCPDFARIRKEVPIVDVAGELGIDVLRGNRARCWRVENHEHGDRTPSFGFQVKKNRCRCFVCDDHSMSNLDLVMLFQECSLKEAALWISERFPVPSIPRGQHIQKREAWFPRYHSGVNENVMTLLIRSGIWADLTHAEQSILAVLVTFSDSQDGYAEISYRGLMRYGAVGSQASVSRAIKHFERMHVLTITRHLRGVSKYVLTIDDPRFDALLKERVRRTREEIALEKELRRRQKTKTGGDDWL